MTNIHELPWKEHRRKPDRWWRDPFILIFMLLATGVICVVGAFVAGSIYLKESGRVRLTSGSESPSTYSVIKQGLEELEQPRY